MRAGAGRGVPRARGHGALVAHPARPRQPRARRRVLDLGRTGDPDADAWTVRAPDDAEAWFYLGGAYAARVQWRVLREERLAAARDGKRIKDALERALALDPGLDDAYFGIGMYRYYADVAPAAAKILRFLLLLPGGDRAKAWRRCSGRANHGRLLQGEADYQLQRDLSLVRAQTGRALELLRELQRGAPGQSDLPDADRRDSGRLPARRHGEPRSWRTLLAQARADRVHAAGVAEVRARLGHRPSSRRAGADRRGHRRARPRRGAEARRAARVARPGVSAARRSPRPPERPSRRGGGLPRGLAAGSIPAGVDSTSSGERVNIRREAAAAWAGRPTRSTRRGIPSVARRVARDSSGRMCRPRPRRWSARSRSTRRDPVARYRYGRVLQARRDDRGALAQFALTISEARLAPAPSWARPTWRRRASTSAPADVTRPSPRTRWPRISLARATRHTAPPRARWHAS